MDVLKFGGTSVGSASTIKQVVHIISASSNPKIVVLSAMSGVTNLLVGLHQAAIIKDKDTMEKIMETLTEKHHQAINELFMDSAKASVLQAINTDLEAVYKIALSPLKPTSYAELVTYGETLLTRIFSEYLTQQGQQNVLLDAKTFMHVGTTENPNVDRVSSLLKKQFAQHPYCSLFITQGFVCLDENKAINTLKRGGSDFSATIMGAAINAEAIQIWTDIDGLHNNDPRYVEGTRPIEHLTYNEAAELAYFGAKVLHPQTVAPVIDRDIPIWLKNTFEPQSPGTKISNEYHNRGLKAISAKDGITVIKIRSNRMLGAHGFLRTIFEIFDRHETSIDMITTSEVAISLTIDDDKNLKAIVSELAVIAELTVEPNHSIICIVGENLIADHESYKAFGLLNNLPVRMISYGGSNNNISLLVPSKDKIAALQYLNAQLFKMETAMV